MGEFRVVDDIRAGRHAGVRRPGAHLDAGEQRQRRPVRAEAGVHDPVLGLLPRQILLEDHARPRAPVTGQVQQLVRPSYPGRAGDGGPFAPDERLAVLGHHREARPPGIRHYLRVRAGEDGGRRGHPVCDAQFVQALFAGQLPRQAGGCPGEEKRPGERVGVLGYQHGRLFVGGDQQRRPADPPADAQQPRHQPVRLLPSGGRPDEAATEVAGGHRRCEGVLRHGVHGHPEPPQTADRPHAAVVQGVSPDLHDQPRNAPVDREPCATASHVSPQRRGPSPARARKGS